MAVVDRQGALVAFSEPFAQRFLSDAAAIPERNCHLIDVLAREPDLSTAAEGLLARTLGGERITLPHTLTRPDGVANHYDIEFRPITGTTGGTLGVVVEIHDLTETRAREEAEERFRVSERKCAAIFAQAAVGIVHSDQHDRIVMVNDRFCDIAGHTREELVGSTFLDLTRHDDLRANIAASDRLNETGAPILFEKRYVRPDGSIVWVRVRVSLILNDQGEPICRQAIVIDITARIDAEQALRRQLATATAVANNAASALLLLDPTGSILEVNAAFVDITGYSKEQAIGKDVHKLLGAHAMRASQAPDEICPIVQAIISATPLRGCEETFIRRDGRPTVVTASFTPIIEDSGSSGGVLEFRDVTQEKEVESELRRREERFRFLAEAIPLPIWTTDAQGKVTFANAMLRQRHGMSLEEIRAGHYRERFHPDDRILIRFEWQRCLRTGEPLSTHCRSLVVGHGYRWHLVITRPRMVEGEVAEWIGCAIDLHDHVERERALELTTEVARLLTEDLDLQRVTQTLTDSAVEATSAAGGAFLRREEGTDALWVKAIAGRPLGTDDESLRKGITDTVLLRYLSEVVRLDDFSMAPTEFREALIGCLPTGGGYFRSFMSVPVTSRAGHLQGVLVLVHPLPGRFTESHESLVCAFTAQATVAIENATLYKNQSRLNDALIEARDRALAASRAKSEFLANMSHEVRTPLNGVIGTASVLKEMDLGPEASEMVATILASGDTLLKVIDDVLALAALEQGGMSLKLQVSDLTTIASSVVRNHRASAHEKGIGLVYSGPPTLGVRVLVDGQRLYQLLANLVTNAIKFTRVGAVQVRLRCSFSLTTAHAVFEVVDTGIGIPPDRLHKVFDSFAQADGSTRRQFGGAGLGLTIAQRLVELMGGAISATSIVGKGTTFIVELDLPTVSSIDTADSSRAPDPPISVRVLLAEDNEVNVVVARRMLQRCGCQVDVAPDGLVAIDLAQANRYDLVLMDLQMPRCDGYEAAREIRKTIEREGRPDVPIIALTANAMQADRDASVEAGMKGFLVKPLKIDDLREMLAGLPTGHHVTRTDEPPAGIRTVDPSSETSPPENESFGPSDRSTTYSSDAPDATASEHEPMPSSSAVDDTTVTSP